MEREALRPVAQGSLKAGWGSGGHCGNTYCTRQLLPSSLARRYEKSNAAAVPLNLGESSLFLTDGESDWTSYWKITTGFRFRFDLR